MRGIDRVRRRQQWQARLDRAATVMLAVLALVAGLTLLPQTWQQRLLSWGCQGVTFGVTDCVARLYEPPIPAVRATPQCPVDQVLERMVPTVERQTISFAGGGQIGRWVERGGDIRLVALPEMPEDGPVDAWRTQAWPTTPVLPGVQLPLSAQWRFPDGEGEREVVAALQQQHAHEYQRFSALAAFLPGDPAARGRATEPTAWLTQGALADIDSLRLPEEAPVLEPGRAGISGTAATAFQDRVTGEVLTTVPAAGLTRAGQDVQGVIRWARSDAGVATELAATLVWDEGEGTAAVHLALPLAEGDGATFESWMVQEDGPDLDLELLLAERAPEADDRFEQLVAAAGVVAYEEFAVPRGDYVETTWQHLSRDRRPYGELPQDRTATSLVRPQPSGIERSVQEVQC